MIIVFGSIGLDIVQSVHELPRAGETVLTADYIMLPGGKGANQALAAARASSNSGSNVEVQFVASIGDDDFGARALRNLKSVGVDLAGVAIGSRPTACATISVDHRGENQIVVSSGANLETVAGQLHPRSGDVVLQQMEIPLREIWAGIDLAHENGAQTILNAAPFQPIPTAVLEKLDVLIVNEIEAEMMAADLCRTMDLDANDLQNTCAKIHERFDLTVVLTLGAKGAVAFAQAARLQVSALDITALDTVGAGDAFVGAFVAALSENRPLGDCLRWGSVAGGLACLAPGAQDGVPDHGKIIERIGEITLTQSA